MMFLAPAIAESVTRAQEARLREVGEAAGYLIKAGAAPTAVYALSGRLIHSASGWGLLEVPNALVRGLFAALDVPGAELPLRNDRLNAHISVLRPEELESLGGAAKITEWGRRFRYQLGPVQEVQPAGWAGVSKVWFVRAHSPELQQFRKSYGLSALPNEGRFHFHITVAIRKTGVLKAGPSSKAASLTPELERILGRIA